MKVAVLGHDGPLVRRTRAALEDRGHAVVRDGADCVIFCPGSLDELEALVSRGGFRRLVLRSHAYAYGSSTKNPGLMAEDRISLLPAGVPEQRWLRAEEIAARFPNHAAIRLTNVLHPDEGDLIVQQLSRRVASHLAGHDPNFQFISVSDAARALVCAAESSATGLFNAAGEGAIPLKRAFRAAGTTRIPVPRPLFRLFGRHDTDQLQYNWTVSGERALRELGFRPEKCTVSALAEFLAEKPGADPASLETSYDHWGLNIDHIRAWGWWFAFLRRVYWRIEHEGMENVPQAGRAMLVANHRGFMPLDAVMHLSLMFTHRARIPRFLIIHSLLRIPYLCNFLTKMGGVIASQENAALLFAAENIVGIFPEGIRGAFSPLKTTYRLRDFAKSAFARIAIENRAPIIPAAVVGHAEIFPIIGRINWSWITREFGWPYLPIAPMFPLAPVPIPVKWHVRILEPVPVDGLSPADAENPRLLRDFSRHIQAIVQTNVDEMVRRRRGLFRGRFLDGTHPPAPAFDVEAARAARVPARRAASSTTTASAGSPGGTSTGATAAFAEEL